METETGRPSPAEAARQASAALTKMLATRGSGPTRHPVEEPGEQASLLDDLQPGTTRDGGKPPTWTADDLSILGERVRDHLRKVARRAVTAFVCGGIERGDAELYVSEDLAQVARETWTAPKGTKRPERGAGQ